MEDGVLSPGTMLRSSAAAMEFDYMDELLLEGCWLETTDGSEFFNPNLTSPFFDPSFAWPASEIDNGDSNSNPLQKSIQEVNRQMSPLLGNSPWNELQSKSLANAQFFGQNVVSFAAKDSTECSDVNRRWWIGPRGNQGPGASVRDRLVRALDYIQEFAKAKDVLIQLWVPINRGGRCVLTTQGQPFAVDSSCPRLAGYRDISENYQFSAEKDSNGLAGLPGRVFLGKVPEWTPDVRFFRSDEYPRVDHAQRYDVRGTLALPVFEQGSRTCLGVIEVVTTKQTIKYRPELESVCKALEAVDLRSSEVLSPPNIQTCDLSYEAALPEILKVLKSACETHKLPLAQTWVPCIQQGKGGCRHSDENYFRCVSTIDHACYVRDPTIQGFHEACSEHHLLKGQGVAGGAFMTNQPCFSSDITSMGKTEYPLSHHAKMFGLRAAVAIRLRSVQTGSADFVLEFFLPVECIDSEEQKEMLGSLSIIIRQVCQTLRVVTDEELMEEIDLPVSELTLPADVRTSQEEKSKVQNSSPERQNEEAYYKGRIERNEDSALLEGSYSSVCTSKSGEKKRPKAEKAITKAEKAITLQVLRQYFAGSLKDAAKNIGVCPTTLKRICRQHGIMRWPSRKIKKVGHSLQKLQHVIDSVQGASGALHIGSFYANFPELASPNLSGTSTFSTSTPSDHPKLSSIHPEECVFNSQAAAPKSPSSSCSQSSSSSQCCSSGMQNPSSTFNAVGSEDVAKENSENCIMKRVKSTAELHTSSPGEKPLARSQSHRSLKELAVNSGNLPPLPKSINHTSQDVDGHRVKVSYGSENIRFRMPNSWGFKDLAHEIARRFSIDDISTIDLKYLDDDSEWVLLTCDDDLEECIDVCRSSQNATIKLSLQVSHLGGSFGSTSPL